MLLSFRQLLADWVRSDHTSECVAAFSDNAAKCLELNHPKNYKRHWRAVIFENPHPGLSYRQFDRSQSFASNCIRLAILHDSGADQPGPGRPHQMKQNQHILAAAKQMQRKSVAVIVAKV